MPPRFAKLAGLGAFGAIALFVGLFALIAYGALPRSTGGIDRIHAAVTWISVGVVILALAGVHVVVGRGLLELARSEERGSRGLQLPRCRTTAIIASIAAALTLSGCVGPFARQRPSRSSLRLATPDSFRVRFETTRGPFEAIVRTAWAPVGADRFYDLVQRRFYDDVYFCRVVPGFVAQFGLSGDPAVTRAWRIRRIADDSVRQGNARGTLSFARGGPGTRTTQVYVNLRDNFRLDTLNGFGFPAFAQVVSGMSAVDSLYSGYSAPPAGSTRREGPGGPSQDSISQAGNAYLARHFPKLDRIVSARVVEEWR